MAALTIGLKHSGIFTWECRFGPIVRPPWRHKQRNVTGPEPHQTSQDDMFWVDAPNEAEIDLGNQDDNGHPNDNGNRESSRIPIVDDNRQPAIGRHFFDVGKTRSRMGPEIGGQNWQSTPTLGPVFLHGIHEGCRGSLGFCPGHNHEPFSTCEHGPTPQQSRKNGSCHIGGHSILPSGERGMSRRAGENYPPPNRNNRRGSECPPYL